MSTVPRRQVDGLVEALTVHLEQLPDSLGLARVLGILDAVQGGASITSATEALARIESGEAQ